MTDKEILDYNKRCAEFLGMYDYSKDNEYFDKEIYFSYPQKEKNPGCGYFKLDTAFTSDWNWIMEVIQEIRRLVFPVILEKTVFCKWGNLINALVLTDKKLVVKRLNEFLIWYNTIKN